MFSADRRDGVTQLGRPDTRWLSTGFDGGRCRGDAAYNVTVPDGWPHQPLAAYVDDRLADAGFDADGPALLTGVSQRHARGARAGSVEAVATVGVSNPAPLPADPAGGPLPDRQSAELLESDDGSTASDDSSTASDARHTEPGTVNVIVGTRRALEPGALANLLAVVSEARAVTLQRALGVPGTTSDAVIVGCDPTGEPARFAGSATRVGAAARVCVREAVTAGLAARYTDESPPESVATARHGLRIETEAERFRPGE